MVLANEGGSFGIVVEVLNILLSLTSISLNILVSHILVRRLGLTQTDTVISFILCIVDFIYSFYSIVNLIITWASGYLALQVSDHYCQFNGSFLHLIASSFVDTVMILGILRCLAICYKRHYSIMTWVIINICFIIFNLALSALSFTQSPFTPYPSLKYCGFKPKQHMAHILWYAFGTKEGICVLIIVVVYLRIAYYYYSYLKELKNDNGKVASQFHPRQSLEDGKSNTNSSLILNFKEIESSVNGSIRKIYIIIAIYLLEFMFIIGVQTTYKLEGTLPNVVVDNIQTLVLHFIPLTNPLFILFFHDETNHELRSFFSLIQFKFLKKLNSSMSK
ncbi:hypothetical protein CONCODRAFT_10113 [Conidiobolus coronatus NRRL 28638]|uniref:G-protein coupled receptors family 1 profile domain-containing protein n=1 Tax=Conidiobolus coronatus (strain ATCC 28846 / CBS 209.66 / NRRL 28638) TaxID=796925 RepID=A0A137NYA0_CONC2|nr:hypothetical protein CONCODRAFT_10113 [Conidiobolus coronatus NRRL 28638]|eukprot:KXN67756.1 hypothetical protein CONCODRAFT_10113 [Conidiobolus coronatus NRRL 28638]